MEAVVGEGCARNFGQNLAAYSDLALDINGHDDGLAQGNQHIGLDSPGVTRNTQAYQQLDKSQGEYYCANGYGCYGEQTEHILRNARSNPEPVATLKHYQIRERLNAQGLVVGYEAYNPESGNIIVMLPEELPRFRQVVEAIPAVGYSLEAMSHAEHTGANAQAGLYDQGYLMGIGDAAVQHATDPNTLFDIAIGGISAQASGQVFRFVPKRESVQPHGTSIATEFDGPASPVYKIESGAQANQPGQAHYGDRYITEHVPNRSVVTTELPDDVEMVHVFNVSLGQDAEEAMVGNWIMPRSELLHPDGSLMSPLEIQQKFSLPSLPTHIVDVVPDRPVRATVSTTAGHSPEGGGLADMPTSGGGQQWRLLEDTEDLPESWFQSPRPLEGD